MIFAFFALVLKMISAYGYVLSIQGYLGVSIPTLLFCVGVILIYVYLMVMATTGLRIIASILFAVVMVLSIYGIVITDYERLSSEEHRVDVEIYVEFSGPDRLTNEPTTIYRITFYENKGLFSEMLDSLIYYDENPFHYVIEGDQLIVTEDRSPNDDPIVYDLT